MNIFDRFIWKNSSILSNDRHYQLIALSCYSLAKKLRANVLTNNENEKLSLIFSNENYSDEEIFVNEKENKQEFLSINILFRVLNKLLLMLWTGI